MVVPACGVPGRGEARKVDDATVPYRLLDSDEPSHETPEKGRALDSRPLVYWLVDSGQLLPVASSASCSEQSSALVAQILTELATGPTDEARAEGRATAIAPDSGLRLAEIVNKTAKVDVDPGSQISAELLPVVIGQIVLSVTSASGVETVVFASDGHPVQVPLPGGALTSTPVTAVDYAALVPRRFQDRAPLRPGSTRRLGCP
jgi:spore germination protein GerM